MNPLDTARELLRAVRGTRSQQAFSRRLGYASNVVAKWEAGRRMPTAAEALRACRRAGLDVDAAFTAFRAPSALLLGSGSDAGVAAWLAAQRGTQPLAAVAARAGCSRYRVARFLSGQTRPRLPEFLALTEAMTGRLCELVAALVPIERVPSLAASYLRVQAARHAVFEEPWSSAVLALLASGRFSSSASDVERLAHTLAIAPELARRCIDLLQRAGVLVRRRGRYRVRSALLVDTRSDPAGALALRRHWAGVGRERLHSAGSADLFSYNVFSVSRADYARMRQLQVDFFQQMRAIAVASEPSEIAGLVTWQLLGWDPEQNGAGPL